MKYFISLRMMGKTDQQIKNDIAYVKEQILKTDKTAEFLDTFIEEELPEKNIGVRYLAKSIEILADADIAVFYGDWKQARGCRVEEQVAKSYNIKRKYIEG